MKGQKDSISFQLPTSQTSQSDAIAQEMEASKPASRAEPVSGDASASRSVVGYRDAFSNNEAPLHEVTCDVFGHDTISTDTIRCNVEDGNIRECIYQQSKDAVEFVSDFSCPYASLVIDDETSLPYKIESGMDLAGSQVEDIWNSPKAGNANVPRYSRQEVYLARPTHDTHVCATQSHGCADVRIGFCGEIARWRKNSEITYVVCLESFPPDLSSLVEEAMVTAIDMWVGICVSFKQVSRYDLATFAVIYDDRNHRTAYARSFFPNEPARELIIYELSLKESDCLANILAHELGHILGLRHEFAHEKEKKYPSVLFGSVNGRSIMNYFDHPRELRVNEQDIEELKCLYAYDQAKYGELDILDYDPEKRLHFTPSSNRLLSLVDSAAIETKHLPIYLYLYWLDVNTTMQYATDLLFFVFFTLFMIWLIVGFTLFLPLYLTGFCFFLC